MDFWKSDYEGGKGASVLAGLQEFIDSPNMSSNSPDSLASDQHIEPSKIRFTEKITLSARRQLQPFPIVNQLKLGNVKEKNDSGPIDKTPKPTFKKAKKTVYPDEAAKAVIRDIEMLKRTGYGYAPPPGLPSDFIFSGDTILPISLSQVQVDSPGGSLLSDLDERNAFKKREIKCRNIRRSDSYHRRSVSPKSRENKPESSKKDRSEYPKNWSEYIAMGLNPQKDALLKSKVVKKPKDKKFGFKNYFNFRTPPVPIEIYRSQSKTGSTAWIPFPYLKCTASKPQVLYSTNEHNSSPGHLTREQLFTLIPNERKLIIEKLGKLSRCEADDRIPTDRKWYPRNWKKTDNCEGKLLEKSVGLSFLQSYSDEEEDTNLEYNNEETVIEKEVINVEVKKDISFIEDKKEIVEDKAYLPEKKELTPVGTPKAVENNLEDRVEKEELRTVIKSKTSKWDDAKEEHSPSSYKTTPSFDGKEEGEVLSEEEKPCHEESLIDIGTDEYEKTKEELKKLEEVLKSSTDYIDSVTVNKEVETKVRRKKKENKKRKKVPGSKISKSKSPKKKSKKKLERKEKVEVSSSSESSESEEESSKKKKQKKKKKDAKAKSEKNKKRKTKKKKKQKKVQVSMESEQSLDKDSDMETSSKRKKKKVKGNGKSRKRTISGDSQNKTSDRKNSMDIAQDDYEDDIKFFAARFDAENKLKGKTKHKAKTNINLDDLTLHPRTEEKSQKRKAKWESSESDSLFSPEMGRKKESKEKDGAENAKKEEVKIDLLKLNEEYLREQKRKEERDSSVVKESDYGKDEENHSSKRDRSLSVEKSKEKNKSDKKAHRESRDPVDILTDKPSKVVVDLEKPEEEIDSRVPEDKSSNTSKTKVHLEEPDLRLKLNANRKVNEENQPDWEQIRKKRKRRSGAMQAKLDKNSKHDSIKEIIKVPYSEIIPVGNIKQEKDVFDIEIYHNSWESEDEVVDLQTNSDRSIELEIPLNINFLRKEVKVEKDVLNTDELLTQPSLVSAEAQKILKEPIKPLDPELQILNQEPQAKIKRLEEVGCTQPQVHTPTRKRRWDIKSSTPVIKLEKPDEIIHIASTISNTCITLEDEYEEFIKAVSSTKQETCNDNLSNPIVIDGSSDSSVLEDSKEKSKIIKTDNKKSIMKNISKDFKNVLTNIEESHLKPALDIPTIQIPLPPIKSEPIKPVPVPSPKLEAVLDLNKPLINLSLSANVTQNITLSLATSIPSISAPVTSSIDISKPSVEFSTPIPSDTVVSMNNIPLPFTQTSQIPPVNMHDLRQSRIPVAPNTEVFMSDISDNSPKVVPSNIINNDQSTNNKLVFTSLTLPSKKLLDNSKLNLDDSDSDDINAVEEIKRRKLEALIEDNKREVLSEQPLKLPVVAMEEKIATSVPVKVETPATKEENSKRASPHRTSSRRAETSPKRSSKRESSPSSRRSRESPVKRRESSPRRRLSPSRKKSPKRSSPRRRSPIRRKKSPPARRSASPRRRRSSVSPRRRRSPSPRKKRGSSPRRNRSPSPRSRRSSTSKESRSNTSTVQRKSARRSRSPINQRETSPLKRSVADSTISDDQLAQEDNNYLDIVFPKKQGNDNGCQSPKRVPLDVRISQVLGFSEPSQPSPKPPLPTPTHFYHHETSQPHSQHYHFGEHYSTIQSQVTVPPVRLPQSTYKQVGNMLQIVPTENLPDIPMPHQLSQSDKSVHVSKTSYHPTLELNTPPPKPVDHRPQQILQVGNMLQIVPSETVPTELIPVPPIQTEIKIEKTDESWTEMPVVTSPVEKPPSAETSMLLKVAERRAERENRRQEREKRRKEKDKRRKEKEKVRQAKIKTKTENMIMKALELEEDIESDALGNHHTQWPPVPIIVNHTVFKEVGKSILLNSGSRQGDESFTDERKFKVVQFADGIRPGEGTSPSAGEDLMSPPPPKKKLPKEKRFKKVKFGKKSSKKNGKKKVKVKIIKKPPSPLDESDSDDNLPPPSPPPGSPPPHIFPPRIKVNPVNNVPAAYLASIIQSAQQQQRQPQQQTQYQSNLYRTPINLLMAPPPPPQGHLSSIPPHVQSPHGSVMPPALSPQAHYHPGLAVPPPPPPPPPHPPGHSRHY